MSDFEMMCAMYDRAEIEYTLDAKANFYADDGETCRTIKTEADWEGGVCGYRGFVCYHTFDADGKLLNVYIWE